MPIRAETAVAEESSTEEMRSAQSTGMPHSVSLGLATWATQSLGILRHESRRGTSQLSSTAVSARPRGLLLLVLLGFSYLRYCMDLWYFTREHDFDDE